MSKVPKMVVSLRSDYFLCAPMYSANAAFNQIDRILQLQAF